jgi:hypothetical protein
MPDANLKQCSCALTGRSSLSAKAVTGLELVLLLWLGLQSNLLALTTSAVRNASLVCCSVLSFYPSP